MDTVDRCVAALRGARNDTEKFAALFVLSRTTDASLMSPERKREVFAAVGFGFLHRLLRTECMPEGCDPHAFRSLAVSVLSTFCADPELARSRELLEELDVLKNMVAPGLPGETVRDSVRCISAVATYQDGLDSVLQCGLMPCLVDVYVAGSDGHDEALRVVVRLAASRGDAAWADCPSSFVRLVESLASKFKTEPTVQKTELSGVLAEVLEGKKLVVGDLASQWMADVRDGLVDSLRRGTSEVERIQALRLAGLLMGKFDVLDLLDHTDGGRKFVAVLVLLACVEIRIILERESVWNILQCASSLSVCYSVLECAVTMMSDEAAWRVVDAQTERLLAVVRDTFGTIINFLKLLSSEWEMWTVQEPTRWPEMKVLAYATIRVLCAWLAEETSQLRPEVCSVLPFIVGVAARSVFPGDEPGNEECGRDVDLMRFMLAPLCHLTADDTSRVVLVSENVHVTLYRYIEHQWKCFLRTYSAEVESSLATLCGIFLNIVVLESRLVSENEVFFALLKFLFCASHQLSNRPGHLLLKGNFAVLGLLTARHHHKKIKCCETFFYKYLSASVKFLWDAHHVDATDVPALVLAQEYSNVWSDLMELWFLGMQALATLLNMMPWVASFLLESGWPQLILSSLGQVDEHSIEASVKSAYQDFLCCITRACKDAVPALLECGAEEVCKTHKLKDLAVLLVH